MKISSQVAASPRRRRLKPLLVNEIEKIHPRPSVLLFNVRVATLSLSLSLSLSFCLSVYLVKLLVSFRSLGTATVQRTSTRRSSPSCPSLIYSTVSFFPLFIHTLVHPFDRSLLLLSDIRLRHPAALEFFKSRRGNGKWRSSNLEAFDTSNVQRNPHRRFVNKFQLPDEAKYNIRPFDLIPLFLSISRARSSPLLVSYAKLWLACSKPLLPPLRGSVILSQLFFQILSVIVPARFAEMDNRRLCVLLYFFSFLENHARPPII